MDTIVKRINPLPDGRLIAVSDVHGHLQYLRGLLEKVQFSKKDTLVLIGDMIEKGPESLNTVRFVMGLREKGFHVYASMGNVEYHRMECFRDDSPEGNRRFLRLLHKMKRVWGGSMFLDMMEELGIKLESVTEEGFGSVKAELEKHFQPEFDFIQCLPAIIAAGSFIFVHAGVPTDRLEELEGTEAFSYLKRDEFLREPVAFEKYVVVGHWPVCLYRDDEDSMEPACDWEKHIIALDGGCGLKIGQQLNGLILPGKTAESGKAGDVRREAKFVSYDGLPLVRADRPQKGRPARIVVHYQDSEVECLGYLEDTVGENRVLRLRHISSGIEFPAPESFLYRRTEGKLNCEDCSDALLDIEKGDLLSVVEKTSIGLLVKKNGVMGWYLDQPCSFF